VNSLVVGAVSALGLGIVTAVHPCLIALNIAALALISGYAKNLRPSVFQSLFYLIGRASGYIAVAFIITHGLFAVPAIALFLQSTIYRFVGPALIIIGMMIAGLLSFGKTAAQVARFSFKSSNLPFLRTTLIGLLHTLVFCPASAGLYFGVLLPLGVSHSSPILLSAIYGIGTGLPLIVIITLSNPGFDFLTLTKSRFIDLWVPRISGAFLILVGIYLTMDRIFGIWT
jgi:cytochrome c biogenesis protein CcdA